MQNLCADNPSNNEDHNCNVLVRYYSKNQKVGSLFVVLLSLHSIALQLFGSLIKALQLVDLTKIELKV